MRSILCRAGLGLALGLAGCSHWHQDSFFDPGFRGSGAVPTTWLSETPPRPIGLDLEGLPPAPDGSDPTGESYRGLTERDCLRAAAGASNLGNLLDTKACECRQEDPAPSSPNGPVHPADLLATAAHQERARSAAVGLELYYRLVQTEAQRVVLRSTLAEVDRALTERQRLEDSGLKVPEELDSLRLQRIDLLADRVRLEQGREQLSAELRDRLNLSPGEGAWRVWPLADLTVDPQPVDPEQAIQEGLARHPEIQLLRRLDHMQPPDALRGMKSALTAASPLLALECKPPEPPSLLSLLCAHSGDDAADLARIRQLWDRFRVEREREIVREIRQAALSVRAEFQQVLVARQRLEFWDGEVSRLEAKARRGVPTFAERTDAVLKRLEARSTLWEKVVAWQIAMVKLRRAQGMLLE